LLKRTGFGSRGKETATSPETSQFIKTLRIEESATLHRALPSSPCPPHSGATSAVEEECFK